MVFEANTSTSVCLDTTPFFSQLPSRLKTNTHTHSVHCPERWRSEPSLNITPSTQASGPTLQSLSLHGHTPTLPECVSCVIPSTSLSRRHDEEYAGFPAAVARAVSQSRAPLRSILSPEWKRRTEEKKASPAVQPPLSSLRSSFTRGRPPLGAAAWSGRIGTTLVRAR